MEDDDISDNIVFCEKVINQIDYVFKIDNELLSFEIIAVPFKQNKTPIVHVNHHLGIESWCIKYIYEYAHRMILNHKSMRFQNSIVKYLNCAILINPDVNTFWNVRRQLVEKVQLNLTQEFQFSSIVLSKKPKSSEAFFYRRWLYSFQSCEAIDWAVEISLSERCAERKNGNYHAWNHRQWVLQKAPDLLKYEVQKTEKFIRKNVADYSCYHHRSFVLSKLFDLQYFDPDDMNYVELYEFINEPLADNEAINNIEDLIKYLIPSAISHDANKIKSFLFAINRAVYDLKLIQDLIRLHGIYEAFTCYKRINIKFAIDLTNFMNGASNAQPAIIELFLSCLSTSSKDLEFRKMFLNC